MVVKQVVNPKRPDEILENLSPDDKGHLNLPESITAEGVKYILQNQKGEPVNTTIHIKPENVENYVYVPVSQGKEEEEQEKKQDSEEATETQATETEAVDAVKKEIAEAIPEEQNEAIAANLDATRALRSYFRNFLGINPEDFAKAVVRLRSRPGGDITVANAIQHYIGAKLGAKLARDGVKIKDTYDLIERLNVINPHTGRHEYYDLVREAYKELGYNEGLAKRLTNSFFEFIGDSHVMGVTYAMRNAKTDFGLSWAQLYNQKLQKAGKNAEIYSPQTIKMLHSKLTGGGLQGGENDIAAEVATSLAEEVEETLAKSSDVGQTFEETAKEIAEDLVAAATSPEVTAADIEAVRANLLKVNLDGQAVFMTPNVNESLKYAVHKAFLSGEKSLDHLARMQEAAAEAIAQMEDADGIAELRALKNYSLGMLEDSGDGYVSGKLIGEWANKIFSREGAFSAQTSDVNETQKRLNALGLLVYAKENGLSLEAKWDDAQYKEAIEFIKENFSIAGAISEYISYEGAYDPTKFVTSAAKTMSAARYALGISDIGAAFKNLADLKTRNAPSTSLELVKYEDAKKITDAIIETAENIVTTKEKQEDEGSEDTDKTSEAEEPTEETAEGQQQKPGILSILPDSPFSTLLEGETLTLKDPDNGEPAFALRYNDDGGLDIATATEEKFTIPGDEAAIIVNKLSELEAAEDPEEEYNTYIDVLSDLSEAKLRHTLPEGAEEAAEAFGEAAAGEEPAEAPETSETEQVAEELEENTSEEQAENEESLPDQIEAEAEEVQAEQKEQEELVQEDLEDVAEDHAEAIEQETGEESEGETSANLTAPGDLGQYSEVFKQLQKEFEDDDDLLYDYRKGLHPITRQAFNSLDPKETGVYPISRTIGNKYFTSVRGHQIEAPTYAQALDEAMAKIEELTQEGKIPQDAYNFLKAAYDLENKYKQEAETTRFEPSKYTATQLSAEHINNWREEAANRLATDMAKLKEPPTEAARKEIFDYLRNTITGLHDDGIIPGQITFSEGGRGPGITINNKHYEGDEAVEKMLDLIKEHYGEDAYETLKGNIEELKYAAENADPDYHEYWENQKKIGQAQTDVNDKYHNVLKYAERKRVSPKTFKKRVSDLLEYADTLAKENGGEIAERIKRGFTRALNESNIELPEDFESLTDLLPQFIEYFNRYRENKGLEPVEVKLGVKPKKTKEQAKKDERSNTSIETPVDEGGIEGQKSEQLEAETGTKQESETEPENAKIPSKSAKEQKASKEKKVKVPAKSNIHAILNTIKEKYVNGKKPPTEGRVKRAIKTQLSKALGDEPTPEALAKLNDYFGTDAESYDDLLTTLAQAVVDAYDAKQSEALKESAKKVKEKQETREANEDTLPSGFDANEIRRGLANFIENYPLPPKAVEDMVAKYGSDFSKWSPEALEELGEKLRTTLGKTSIGQSIQEFFPKGFIVEEPEEENTDENDVKDLDELEGPSDEDLESLEEEEY